MNFFQRLFDVTPPGIVIAAAIAMAAIVLLYGYEQLARRREVRREECRAEEEADAEWEAKRAAYDKARAAGLIVSNHSTFDTQVVKPVSRETRKAPRRKNVRRKTRHK